MSASIVMKKHASRLKRKGHIRVRVSGSTGRPRLSVYRSLNHIYAQVIDDVSGKTLVAASTLSPELKESRSAGKASKPAAGKDAKPAAGKKEQAKEVGKLVAKKCADAQISAVVFDRNGFNYHGRVAAVAEGAREGGLKF